MGFIKEPDGVLLYVEHRQPTPEEDRLVSEYIARYRAEHADATLQSPTQKRSASVSTSASTRTTAAKKTTIRPREGKTL